MYFRGVVRGKPSNSAGFAEKMAAFGLLFELHVQRSITLQFFRPAR